MAFAPARVAPFLARRLQVPVQVLLYAGLFVCAEYLVNWLHLPLPANLVGMLMLLMLIVCRVIPLNWVRAGARWLLAEMLLFFVPAVVAVVNYAQLLMVDGWRIFLVIALSTTLVLGATAWVVDKVYRYEVSRLKDE
ncbi:CidA/LrgA family protein [Klebsiella aerogenes]|uniref:CidA/LrgA family protein n=1 Tax=Klebsiella aerogenes TaxID=548 RepID=UPI000B422437|nr:CidA/LrgA family protein [Klebsiella aerogenes]ELT7620377.1 CidA/LrgA family protein [Klebsiella aerogenes]ELY3086624.1 CidA/LrgA family protein [Klebsiella aerogenes]MEB7638869.1 CidA/LrgA family protein [Klebsiella aerogenes]RNT31659.1 CidA/LrgA family protein [Klebsiella aerogenes]HDS4948990.1 CidA/LrgA family protein [Klebsiella aerogenes]